RELLSASVPALTRFLRRIVFVCEYPLVVGREDRAELWMGLRRPKRLPLAAAGGAVGDNRVALCNRDGRPAIALWPLVQVAAPAPGAAEELFLFEGKGRRGARLTALPRDFELHDEG